jgi:O-methyltransferase involved in polyketide biosynthesis
VTGAAGYDGRSLRYERPGTLWFEIDHPATQSDKRARLGRLGIHSGRLRFVAADFTTDPVADLPEPADAGALFAAAGWRTAPVTADRAAHAGFVIAAPAA